MKLVKLFIIEVCFGFVLFSRDTVMLCNIQINLYRGRPWYIFHNFNFVTCTVPCSLFLFNSFAVGLLYGDLLSCVPLIKDTFPTEGNGSDITLWPN